MRLSDKDGRGVVLSCGTSGGSTLRVGTSVRVVGSEGSVPSDGVGSWSGAGLLVGVLCSPGALGCE